MHEVNGWLARQARRDRSQVRLEDALLADRWAAYFAHRLRFFVARGVVATLIHAIKVVLLVAAFPQSEFVLVIVLQAAFAVAGDVWWGALEVLRSRVRGLQRRGSRHLAPREIGGWLRLSAGMSLAGLGACAAFVVVRFGAPGGSIGPGEAYALALGVGVSIDITARAYHSGAYALRRVYRPLPSLLAVDVVSVGALLSLWPLMGIWAFPVAELLSGITVAAMGIRYTSRTYRTLGIPTLGSLLRSGYRVPRPAVLRTAIRPAVAYGLIGFEALLVIAGLTSAAGSTGIAFVVMLAALGPIIRAGFEWARLVYFDFKRLEVPLLDRLRRRFEHAVLRLALAVGIVTWAVAAVIAATLLGVRQPFLLALLLPFFMARSLLAAAQMRAFTRIAYGRLTLVGIASAVAALAAFWTIDTFDWRIVALTAILAVSFVLLLALPAPPDSVDGTLALPDWAARLRRVDGPVTVMQLTFDDRVSARGVPIEVRLTEAWRRRMVARRVAARVRAHGGLAAWSSPTELWCYSTAGADPVQWVRLSGGLVRSGAPSAEHPNGQAAIVALMTSRGETAGNTERPQAALAGVAFPGIAQVAASFSSRFPGGIAYDTSLPVPRRLANLSSAARAEILRSALFFCRDLEGHRGGRRYEVTALVIDGSLRLIFAAERGASFALLRRWRQDVRGWSLAAAAGAPTVNRLDQSAVAASPTAGVVARPQDQRTSTEGGTGASEAGML